MSQKAPRQFFQPLAAGAPEPMRELPVRVERMIQFVPPHLDKVRAKVPGMAETCDVVLGNLEDVEVGRLSELAVDLDPDLPFLRAPRVHQAHAVHATM